MRLFAFMTIMIGSFIFAPLHANDAAESLSNIELSALVMNPKQALPARIQAFRQLYPEMDGTVTRSICVWDPIGKNGPIYNLALDRTALMMQLGMLIDLKAYTNEGVLTEDLKAGQCDAALFTGLRARSFNRYTGTLDALGALPDSEHMHLIMRAITSPKAASKMVEGQFVVMGYAPLGAVYLFVNDRRINTLADVAGKRFAVMDYDNQQVKMVARLGAQPIPTAIVNIGSKFNNRGVDILPAPLVAYSVMELYKGLGADGGIVSYPFFQMTLQLVGHTDKFPKEFSQLVREELMDLYFDIETVVNAQIGDIPQRLWIPVPEEKMTEYQSIMQSARVTLRDEGYYDPDMLSLARKVRCKFSPTSFECTNPVE
jgi:hypothetical protein